MFSSRTGDSRAFDATIRDGKLTAEDWTEQREQLEGEHAAARAEADCLGTSLIEVEGETAILDAEDETLRRLSDIRRTIAGEVQGSANVEAVRVALVRLFEAFVVHRSTPDRVHVELMGEVWIEPVIREQAIEGYSEDEQAKLFQRFFRGSTADEEAIPGIGLGLTITKAIVESHGGRLSVESEERRGTSFRIELPVGEPADPRGEGSTQKESSSSGLPRS